MNVKKKQPEKDIGRRTAKMDILLVRRMSVF